MSTIHIIPGTPDGTAERVAQWVKDAEAILAVEVTAEVDRSPEHAEYAARLSPTGAETIARRTAADRVRREIPLLPALPEAPAWSVNGWGLTTRTCLSGEIEITLNPRGEERKHLSFVAWVEQIIDDDGTSRFGVSHELLNSDHHWVLSAEDARLMAEAMQAAVSDCEEATA